MSNRYEKVSVQAYPNLAYISFTIREIAESSSAESSRKSVRAKVREARQNPALWKQLNSTSFLNNNLEMEFDLTAYRLKMLKYDSSFIFKAGPLKGKTGKIYSVVFLLEQRPDPFKTISDKKCPNIAERAHLEVMTNL